jgi:two-component system OmpR family sensor kinase
MSLRLRLTLWYTGILAVTLLLFGIVLYFLLSAMTNNQYKDILQKHADKVYQRIEFGLSLTMSGWDLDIQLDEVDTFLSKEIYLQVVNLSSLQDLSQIKVSRSSNAEQDQITIPITQETIKQVRDGTIFFDNATIQGYPFLIYNMPIIVRGQVVGILQASVVTNEFLNDLRFIFILASLFTILIASSLGWFLARKALKPLDNVIAAADQIEKGADLDKRITYEGPNDEIGRLTSRINGMLSRIQTTYTELEEAYAAQRRFVSDASHELRTPLTTIRGNVDLIHKVWTQPKSEEQASEQEKKNMSIEAMRDIADEAERMTRLVNDLLSLARADAGHEMDMELVEMKPLVEEVIRKSQFIPKKVDWEVGDLSALTNITIRGNKDYIQQMLFIFIENAFKYTDRGYVRMDASTLENQVGIHITDTGMGMDEDEVPHIFERFYRADVSRGITSGTGLGLSIAKWIIDEHDGSVEVITDKDAGTKFIVWLPVCFSPTAQ